MIDLSFVVVLLVVTLSVSVRDFSEERERETLGVNVRDRLFG